MKDANARNRLQRCLHLSTPLLEKKTLVGGTQVLHYEAAKMAMIMNYISALTVIVNAKRRRSVELLKKDRWKILG